MNSYQRIQVRHREHGFGAEISGLNLAQPLSADVMAEVRKAWLSHQVVWFPNQPLKHEELEGFSLAMGEFGDDPYVAPIAGHAHILEVRRDADEKNTVFGGAWHSDWSFQVTPPSATILHSKIVPPVGGDTLFADGYRAYDVLSPRFRTLLDSLVALHSAKRPYSLKSGYATETNKRSMKILSSDTAEAVTRHPLVRTHGETGRKALFVNPVYTLGIDGMHEDESNALLTFLYQHMTREEFIYRHRWQPHMLTMWDNRCVMHNATGGYDGYERVMHRTTVRGERPQ